MRLRNVKNAKEIVNNHKLVVTSNPFKNKPLEIEIGTGKGDFIIEKAKRNPDINYIGIEKYESVLIRALEKCEDLPNLRFMCIDAEKIMDYFDNEVDKIYLNFSDPWPKKRHAKRRLTSPLFLDRYYHISKDIVVIEMKTDNKDLFSYSLIEFNNNGYTFDKVSLDYNDEDNIMTLYEKKFRGMNIPINYLKVYKEK